MTRYFDVLSNVFNSVNTMCKFFDLCIVIKSEDDHYELSCELDVLSDQSIKDALISNIKNKVTEFECEEGTFKLEIIDDMTIVLFEVNKDKLSNEEKVDFEGKYPLFNNVVNGYIDVIKYSNKFREKLYIYDEIFNEIPVTIAFKDMKGIYRLASKEADSMYNDKFDTIVGKTIDEVYSTEERNVVRKLDEKAITNRKAFRQVVDVETQDGFKKIDAYRLPIYNSHNALLGIASVGFDVTEQVKLSDQLQQTTKFQKILIEVAKQYTKVDYINFDVSTNYALKLLGEALGADRTYLFHYDFSRNIMDNTHEWCNDGIETMIDELQGVPINEFMDGWVNKHLKNESVVCDDISKLDKESSLYEILSMQDIKSIISMPIMIQNKLYGFIGFDAVKEHRAWAKEYNNMALLPEFLAGIIVRNRYDHDLRREMVKSERASKAKSGFLAVMSHEIRTPMSGIKNVHYLLNQTELSPEQKELLEVAETSMGVLKQVVNNVLDYSVIEANKLVLNEDDIDLEDIIIKVIDSQQYLANDKDIDLFFEYDYRISTDLISDDKKIQTIFMNLINNGIKYTSDGDVTVRISLLNSDKYYEEVRFEVVDTGIGIDKEHINNLFDMFYRADSTMSRKQTGTGIGLSLSNRLINFLGGTLSVESIPGEGSIFSFTLPFRKSGELSKMQDKPKVVLLHFGQFNYEYKQYFQSLGMVCEEYANIQRFSKMKNKDADYFIISVAEFVPIKEVEKLVESYDFTGMKICLTKSVSTAIKIRQLGIFSYVFKAPISRLNFYDYISENVQYESNYEMNNFSGVRCLVVDDNIINSKVFQLMLEEYEIKVDSITSGYEAIEYANSHAYDIIFMDIQMPEMDGYETTERIRKDSLLNSDTPIIALTANALKVFVDKAHDSGCNEVISKPFDIAEVLNMVSKYTLTSVAEMNTEVTVSVNRDFDLERFESSFSNKAILIDILDTFITDTEKKIVELKKHFEQKDVHKIKESVHYLKSSYGYVYAENMLVISQEILDAYHDDDYTHLLNATEEYFRLYESLIENLNKYKEVRQ